MLLWHVCILEIVIHGLDSSVFSVGSNYQEQIECDTTSVCKMKEPTVIMKHLLKL